MTNEEATPTPDPEGFYRGVGDLVVRGGLYDGEPVVEGQWGPTGFGFGVDSMEQAADLIRAAAADARAMATQDGDTRG
jgi:hypothetical protein